jgi:DNA invertase Pin-like site-specific DNA recombinase
MLIGYARISKADESQVLDLQIDALLEAGVLKDNIYTDKLSGVKDNRPGLENCLKALRKDDILVVWKLDRLGRNLKHLISTIEDLNIRDVGFRVLTGQGVNIDTTTPAGKMIFSIFGAFAEFERELIRERTLAGLKAARARGKKGGRKFQLTKAQVRLAQVAMKNRDTSVSELCKELNITRPTLYRYVAPSGELREFGEKVLGK